MTAGQGLGPLDPIDRQAEIMFGLLMTLTFTGTMSVALQSGATVRDILWAALGCNIAWGIVDATAYLLTTVTERGRDRARAMAIRDAPDDAALRMLRAHLPGNSGMVLSDAEAAAILAWMRQHPPDPGRTATPWRADVLAALHVFILVIAATFPPVLPFLLVEQVPVAMRLSNGIAIAMLVVIGWRLDQQMQEGRPLMRWIVPVIGSVMVAVTIALGG